MPIPIIDLFAGPGGLGEGFASLRSKLRPLFKIALSIEKDFFAHQTLELRAFFRQFPHREVPREYYEYLALRISRADLFAKFPHQARHARREAWRAELGSKDSPPTLVDERIREAIDGDNDWVLIGGPPCQAYSLVGRSRRKNDPTFATDAKHLLYQQYLRILAMHRPPVFVMENVKGMLSATISKEGIFQKIINDLTDPLKVVPAADQMAPLTYKIFPLVNSPGGRSKAFAPEDYVVRSELFGVPQSRHRVILLGLRSDWAFQPGVLCPTKNSIPIERAIGDLPRLRSGLSKEVDGADNWIAAIHVLLHSPALSESTVSPDLRREIRKVLQKLNTCLSRGGEFVPGKPKPKFARNWLRDPNLAGFCNHSTRGHIREDLHRYLFASQFARTNNHTPSLEEFPNALLPKHANVAAAIAGAMFNDRFRVQSRGRPSTTITSHISKDGHYFIHYDPTQSRSLTVREAARLQTFPDNYFFEGPRTEQYKQVGNAVPPLLARQIGKIVYELIEQKHA